MGDKTIRGATAGLEEYSKDTKILYTGYCMDLETAENRLRICRMHHTWMHLQFCLRNSIPLTSGWFSASNALNKDATPKQRVCDKLFKARASALYRKK